MNMQKNKQSTKRSAPSKKAKNPTIPVYSTENKSFQNQPISSLRSVPNKSSKKDTKKKIPKKDSLPKRGRNKKALKRAEEDLSEKDSQNTSKNRIKGKNPPLEAGKGENSKKTPHNGKAKGADAATKQLMDKLGVDTPEELEALMDKLKSLKDTLSN